MCEIKMSKPLSRHSKSYKNLVFGHSWLSDQSDGDTNVQNNIILLQLSQV